MIPAARLPWLGIGVAGLIAVCDQLSKALVLAAFAPPAGGTPLPPGGLAVWPFFNLVLVWNPGVSFGLLDGLGAAGRWLLSGLSVLIMIVLLFWLRRVRVRLTALGLGLVLGGALGNLIDRIRFGAVVDFLDFHAFGLHWPAFNVADAAIVCGVILILADGLRPHREAAIRN